MGEWWARASKILLVLVDTPEHAFWQFLMVQGHLPGREEHGLEQVEQLDHEPVTAQA